MIRGRISIIMGIYNCESTIKEAIDSIINQTYANWELIMCDDGSVDNTYEIAKSFELKYPEKIKVLKNNVNIKLAATLNHCLKYAQGEYIARMDADDISLPTRFKEQLDFLKEKPQYDLIGTAMISFNGKEDIGIKKVIEKPDKYHLKFSAPFAHATILCKKEVYMKLEGYSTSKNVERCEDIDLWFRFFAAGLSGYNLTKPLYKVREDQDAFKRRNFKYGVIATKVCFQGFKLLNYRKRDYIFLLKPIISSATPTWIMKKYHKIKSTKNIKFQITNF